MYIIVTMLAAALVAFTKPGAEAGAVVPFQFRDLKALTDMFVDCDTFIVSDGAILHNIHEVSQPLKLYNKRKEYDKIGPKKFMEVSGDPVKRMQAYLGQKIQLFRKEQKDRNCKAQILVFYRSSQLDKVRSLNHLSGFRSDENPYRYTVLVHKSDYVLKKEMFAWSVHGPGLNNVPYFYHVTMACRNEHDAENSIQNQISGVKGAIRVHYRGWTTCFLSTFKRSCACCKMHDVLQHACKDDPQTLCPLRIAQKGHTSGSIEANERDLATVYKNQYLQVVGLKLAVGVMELEFFQSSRWINFREYIQTVQAEFGRHSVVTRLDELMFPEEIFLHSVLTHHENVTFRYLHHRHANLLPGELIFGPGLTTTGSVYGWITHTAPVGTAGVTFMTCSNVSFIPRSGIFYAPFDGATWFLTLTSVIAVSVAMLMTMKQMKIFPALFLTIYTMVRLLLDNQNRVRKDLVRRGEVMASLTLLMAMVTTILCTGYKGVLTSDLAKSPEILPAPTFEKVLASDWRIGGNTNVGFGKLQNLTIGSPLMTQFKLYRLATMWAETTRMNQHFHSQEEDLQEYQLVSKVLDKFHQQQNESDAMPGDSDACRCNGSYWLFETGSFWHPRLPQQCKNVADDQKFLLSNESIANTIVSWSTASMRPGPVFRSIHRAIEAGMYKWLNKVRRISDAGVYVKDHVMTRVLKKEPKPLSTETVLVSSILRLHCFLCLITMAVLVCEYLWINKKRFYFMVRGWISTVKGWKVREIIGRCCKTST